MNENLIAQRFQRLLPLHQEEALALDLARDLASDSLGSLLSVATRGDCHHELAMRVRLASFAPAKLFRDLRPLAVVESRDSLHFFLPPIEAHPWEIQLLAFEGSRAIQDLRGVLEGLDELLEGGCPGGRLSLSALYRDEEGPFFLPSAYVLPPVQASAHHDPNSCRQEVWNLREELAALCRRYLKMAGGRLHAREREEISDLQHRLVAEESDAPMPAALSPLVDALESSREEGGCLILSGSPRAQEEAERLALRWAQTSERRQAVLRPHASSPLSRGGRGSEESGGPVVILRDFSSYPAFAEGLQRLRAAGYWGGTEILLVLIPKSRHEEAARLYLDDLRRGREGKAFEWILPEPNEKTRTVAKSGSLQGRILEALQQAGRPLAASMLLLTLSVSQEEFAAAATQLFARSQVEFSYGFVDEVGAVQELVLALPVQERVECSAERAAEVDELLAASLEKLSGRGGPGCLWLRLGHALSTDSPRAAALARQLVALAERNGDPFLQYAVYERLSNVGHDSHLKSEDRAKAALVMGGLHRRAGELTRAEELLKRGLKRIGEEEARQLVPMAAELTLELGAITRDRNRHTETQTLIAGALERYGEDLPTHLRARLYLDISWALLKLGRTREAANYCELVLKILDGESYPHEVARAYNQLGVVQYEESNYAQSLINLQRALVLREQAGDAMGVARSYNNLSLTYRSLGRLAEAERCLKRSLEAKIKVGDTLGVAVTQLNLGLLAIDQREYQRARSCAAECLHVARRYRHRQMEAEAHGLLGEAAMGEGHYEEARDLLLRDLELCRAQNYETERLATLRRIVGLMLKLKNLKEAKQRLEEARELLTTVPSLYEASMLQVFQSEILLHDGAHQEARKVLNKAARSFGGMRRYDLQLDCLARRAEIEWESGHKSEARLSFQEARELAMRHEIHRLPAFFHDLEGRLDETLVGDPTPAATDHKLETLAELLGPGGDLEAGRPGAVLRVVAAVLAAPEVHWMRTPRQRSLSLVRGKVSEQAAPNKLQEIVSKTKAGRTAMSFQVRPFTGVRVRGADVGWLCVKRDRVLDEGELAFLLTVAGILSLAGRQATTQVPEDSFATEEKEQPGATYGIIGNSPEIREVLRMIEMVKGNDVTILILGENGTGKDLVARAIHNAGPRAKKEMVAVNCASIPPTLLESELFGHEKGAFTSAVDRRIGLFERAHGGSVFLDEIAEMPLAMQAKLLRVLQDKTFTRVGGSKNISSDVRVMAATNRDLTEEVEQGRFRMDLFYRLNVISIRLPPLRERREDIRPLVHHFLLSFASEFRRPVRGITDEAIDRLMNYDWPGNIRELENVIKKAIVFASRDLLRVEDLPRLGAKGLRMHRRPKLEDTVRALIESEDFSAQRPLMPRLELQIAWELVQAVGNKTKAARLLGITKPTLYSRLRRYAALSGEGEEGVILRQKSARA